jgi:hypothetical protein
VSCTPVPALPEATRAHLLRNQVLPLLTSHAGRHVVHASAVELGAGALAFLGPSGRGKSTLATGFVRAGARFLADDALELVVDAAGCTALPGEPAVRLWDDSRAALVGDAATLAPKLSFTDKRQVLAAAELPFCDSPRPLAAALFLGEGEAEEVAITPLGGAEAVRLWIENSFILDVEDRRAVRRQFDQAVAGAQAVPSFRLDFPRRYEAMAGVRAALERLAGDGKGKGKGKAA